MWRSPLDESLLESFSKYSKVAGILFIILGLVGIIFPVFMTFATVVFVAWLMILSGFMAGYFTYKSDKSDFLGWLKSFILVGVGILMIVYPMTGVGTVGLLLAIYFFIDSFAGFSLALSMRPQKGWIWWLINAILSLVIGVVFIIGWPFTSLYLIGLFVGISLFFDGVTLLFIGASIKRSE